MKPKIIFFGSSKYSVIDAKALNESFGLATIITSPDKPKGRKRELTPSPPKKFALENSVPVLTADELEENLIEKIRSLEPDFLVVADYGHILPDKLLKVAKYEALNIHHSLLPKYRGPTPAPSAILAGETETGVTIIKMTSDVDAGPIYSQEKYKIKPNETTDSLLTALNTIGGRLVVKTIGDIVNGIDKPKPQGKFPTGYTERLSKQSGQIDIENPPDQKTLDRMIRAYHPWPGVWAEVQGNGNKLRIKILPGNKIQPEGKKPMTIKEFQNGYPNIAQKISTLFDSKTLHP